MNVLLYTMKHRRAEAGAENVASQNRAPKGCERPREEGPVASLRASPLPSRGGKVAARSCAGRPSSYAATNRVETGVLLRLWVLRRPARMGCLPASHEPAPRRRFGEIAFGPRGIRPPQSAGPRTM